MKKNLLIGLIMLFCLANASFAGCCPQGLTATNGQKACQTVFSFLAIDFSFLSPRATAADVHVCSPKHGMHRFCQCPACCPDSQCCPECQCCPCQPQCCPNHSQYCPCQPQCCPSCQPQCCPQCNRQSMAPATDEKEMPVNTKQPAVSDDDKKEIPISNKQINNKPSSNNNCPQSQKSMFRLDLFRTFKIQIL